MQQPPLIQRSTASGASLRWLTCHPQASHASLQALHTSFQDVDETTFEEFSEGLDEIEPLEEAKEIFSSSSLFG